MAPTKVIIKGIPPNFEESTPPEGCTKQIKIVLRELLSKFGPVICPYLGLDKSCHSSPPPAKKKKVDDSEQHKLLAHVFFEDAEDAAKACDAAANNEIKVGDNVLALTLVSASSVTIETLDDNSLLKIFTELSPKDKLASEEVCARWKKLMKQIWPNTKTLRLGGIDSFPAKFRRYVLRCGRFLDELKCDVSAPILIDLILKHCKKLKTLELAVYLEDCEEGTFENVFKGLKNLKILKLSHREKFFYQSFMEHLPKSMEKISLCYMSGGHGDVDFVDFDASKFSHLRSLCLSGYEIHALYLVGLVHLKHLSHLELTDGEIYRSITRKLEHLTKLKTLKIPKSGITDEILIKIINNNPDLEHLNISRAPALTDGSVKLISKLPKLKLLDVSKLSVTLSFMAQMPALEELICQECNNLTNWTVGGLIKKSPKLHRLNVRDSSITADLFPIANSVLKRRHNCIELKIETTASADEWITMENLSPLLKIQRTIGDTSFWISWEEDELDDTDNDLNDETSSAKSESSDDSDYC